MQHIGTEKNRRKKPLISLIIPVYNVQNYLDYCMQSIFAQDYQNLEIIMVDDGSTDSSGYMCDEYAKKDARIKVIHKNNGGLSSARNAGNNLMTGDYLTYIDSDDYIRSDYVSRLLNCILEDDSDFVACGIKKVVGDGDYRTAAVTTSGKHFVFDRTTIKYKMLSRQFPMYAPGKLYKSELIPRLTFPEGRLYEDFPTTWNMIQYVNKVTYITDNMYFYRQRSDSIVNTKYKHDRMDQVFFAEQIYKEVSNDSLLRSAAGDICFFTAADNYSLVSKDYPEDKEYLENMMKQYRYGVIKDPGSSMKLKALALCSYISFNVVRLMGRLYKRINRKIWQAEKFRISFLRHNKNERINSEE